MKVGPEPEETRPFPQNTANAEAFALAAGLVSIIAAGKAARGKPVSSSIGLVLAGGLGIRAAELAVNRALGRPTIDTSVNLGQRALSLGVELGTMAIRQTPVVLKALSASLNSRRRRLP